MLYRPRMLARLVVPAAGGAVAYDVPVIKAQLSLNDFNTADELEIEVDYNDAGVDPRLLSGAGCAFYVGNADDFGSWQPTDEDLRFAGRLTEGERNQTTDGLTVRLRFVDYTSFFLTAKRVASDAIPQYSDKLSDAWARLCDYVTGADFLSESIELRGLDRDPQIGEAVASRFSKSGTHLPVRATDDAWAIWANACGMLGLITFIEIDRVVVTTESDYFTSVRPPVFVWGENIEEVTEKRNDILASVGVIVQSFDPAKGAIEALYPPIGDKAIQKANAHAPVRTVTIKNKSVAKSRRTPQRTTSTQEETRIAFSIPYVTDPAKLADIAKRIYEERARQAIQGSLKTAEMFAKRAVPQGWEGIAREDNQPFDLLSLRPGEQIQIQLHDDILEQKAGSFASEAERIAYLRENGLSEGAAILIARSIGSLGRSATHFHVKAVEMAFENDQSSGSFRIGIDFCNKIDAGELEKAAPQAAPNPSQSP